MVIPKTQVNTPMTEDMIYEQEQILQNLGTDENAMKIRAKMQSQYLLSG